MKTKNLDYNSEAREKIRSGVNQLATAVSSTLGPCGRTVLIEKEYGAPVSTKDGVSVAKEINLKDPVENMGAQVIKEVSMRAAKQAGDGTTTATVLAAAMYNEGLKHLNSGVNPVEMKRGMDKAVSAIVSELRSLSTDVSTNDQIRQVATISANNDESVGNIIAEAMDSVGKDGVIQVDESRTAETTLEIVEGMQIDRGFVSPYFVSNQATMTTSLEKPYILIYDKKISAIKEILPLLETCSKQSKPLVIIADDVDGEALATMVLNKARGILNVCAIKAPGFGDRKAANLEDIAILTGGTVISATKGLKLEKLTVEMLGTARTVTVSQNETIIVDGGGDEEAIKARIEDIKSQFDNAKSEYDKQHLQERMSKLVGGVAVLNIGAASEIELKEKKDRVDDALQATRAAVEEGIVPGGGIALQTIASNVEVTSENEDQQFGIQVVLKACKAPFRAILENAGKNAEAVAMQIKAEGEGKNAGYDARNNKVVDMIESGIIDPTKVTRTALELACSVAGTLLTTECVVSIEKEKEEEKQPQYEY
ncbi:GroL Chaperonin GroEL (HSP60 family) [uncultured Caudovirales phage]|uniref:GroL Chaperonin GroEL (HSP60 family) n=1 Tax=uncultured Caudovirales phage TaxID=2100421 RepID=A0A6J5MAH6_9CAUD|nr:GroL Chaperonin GroEL (HSP60 family) [uncultured Caudovirales phage]